jgi:hypothetical protein
MHAHNNRSRSTTLGQLLYKYSKVQVGSPCTAPFFWDRQSAQAQISHFLESGHRKFMGFIQLCCQGFNFIFGEFPKHIAHH